MTHDEEFHKWQRACDKLLAARFGVGIDDLPDWGWYDAFDDGLEPSEAVESYVDDAEDMGDF